MHRSWMTAILIMGVGVVTYAHADERPPAIPVQDLPPFPRVRAEDEALVNLAVASAQEAEEDVIVGASKREQSLGSVASAVSVISGDQIRRFGFRTLAEALNTVTGIYIVNDRAVARVGIRGFQPLGDANTRILVLIDGSSLNEPWSQAVDTSYALPVHLDDVARIEVIRGPVSSVYGTNAFLGIVNIVTLGADKASPAYARVTADSLGSVTTNAGFGYGTVNRQVRGSVAWTRRGSDELPYTAEPSRLASRDAIEWQTDADGVDALNAALQVHFDRLFFQVRGVTRAKELPAAPYNSDFTRSDNQNTDTEAIAELGYNRSIGDSVTLAGRLYGAIYRFQGLLRYETLEDLQSGQISGTPDSPVTFESLGNSRWYGGELRALFELSPLMPNDGKLDVTMGVAAESSQTKSDSFVRGLEEQAAVIERSLSTQGVYSEINMEPTRWLAATAGVRLDLNSTFESKISPRTALFFKWGKRAGIKLLYARGFRNPSIFEVFYEDKARYVPNCTPETDVVGGCTDANLRSELIDSFEVVFWGRPLGGVKLRLSSWQWSSERLIQKNRNTEFIEGRNRPRLQFLNLAGVTSLGAELEASYRDTRGWFAYASASYARVTKENLEVPNAPALVAKLGLSTPRLFDLFHLSSDAAFIGSRLTRDEDITIEPHLTWNAALYVPKVREKFDITLGVHNILGKREVVPLQGDYDRTDSCDVASTELCVFNTWTGPGPGREIYGRVGYQF